MLRVTGLSDSPEHEDGASGGETNEDTGDNSHEARETFDDNGPTVEIRVSLDRPTPVDKRSDIEPRAPREREPHSNTGGSGGRPSDPANAKSEHVEMSQRNFYVGASAGGYGYAVAGGGLDVGVNIRPWGDSEASAGAFAGGGPFVFGFSKVGPSLNVGFSKPAEPGVSAGCADAGVALFPLATVSIVGDGQGAIGNVQVSLGLNLGLGFAGGKYCGVTHR